MKIAIIGAGNMGGAIACGLAKGSIIDAQDIICTTHTEASLERLRKKNPSFTLTNNNVSAAQEADIIILAVKPWYISSLIDELRPVLDLKKHIIISVAAGLDFKSLLEMITKDADSQVSPVLFRVIPNTAIEVESSMTFVSACNASEEQTALVLNMFNELGNAMLIEEKLMAAGTALASCGIAFAFRYIRAAIEGGVELGFYPKQAQEIVAYTVKGAADLLIHKASNPEIEIDKVTTPGGITIKGLNEMEHFGFTSAVIKGLKACK